MKIFHFFRIAFNKHPHYSDKLASGELKESTYNSPAELLESFFAPRIALDTTKKNGDTETYYADKWGQQEGITYLVLANNKTKKTTDAQHQQVTHDDHPYCDVIFDLRPGHGYLIIQRNAAFSSDPDKVAEIIREAFNSKIAPYGQMLEFSKFHAKADDFWGIINRIRRNFHDTIRNISIDFRRDKSTGKNISNNALVQMMAHWASTLNGLESVMTIQNATSGEGLDLEQCRNDLTEIFQICVTENAPIGIRIGFKEFGAFRIGKELDAQFGIDGEDLEFFRMRSKEASAQQEYGIDQFLLTQWIERCILTLQDYEEKPVAFGRRKRSR